MGIYTPRGTGRNPVRVRFLRPPLPSTGEYPAPTVPHSSALDRGPQPLANPARDANPLCLGGLPDGSIFGLREPKLTDFGHPVPPFEGRSTGAAFPHAE